MSEKLLQGKNDGPVIFLQLDPLPGPSQAPSPVTNQLVHAENVRVDPSFLRSQVSNHLSSSAHREVAVFFICASVSTPALSTSFRSWRSHNDRDVTDRGASFASRLFQATQVILPPLIIMNTEFIKCFPRIEAGVMAIVKT